MKCKALFALSFLGLLYIAGCGGGSTTPASPTITSVSVSCTPTSVQTGQTSQCSATVSGTGSYSSGVTWTVNGTSGGSATYGTISAVGLYQAPATAPSAYVATITATSLTDSTKSGSFSVFIAGTIASASQPIVASAGGTISLPGGDSATIPAGVLNSDSVVTLQLNSTPTQPTNTLFEGVGPSLLLSFSPAVGGVGAAVSHPLLKANAASGTSNITFVLQGGQGLSSTQLQGALGVMDVNDGTDNYFALPSSYDATQNATTLQMDPSMVEASSTLQVGLTFTHENSLNHSDSPWIQVWNQNGSPSSTDPSFTDASSTYCPTGSRTLVMIHGMLNSTNGTFGQAGGAAMCSSAATYNSNADCPKGFYDDVLGVEYQWWEDIDTQAKSIGTLVSSLFDSCSSYKGTFDIEAHSEGAVVSLQSIGSMTANTQGKLQHIVLVAGPIDGTPVAQSANNFLMLTYYLNLQPIESAVESILMPASQGDMTTFVGELTPGAYVLDAQAAAELNAPYAETIAVGGDYADLNIVNGNPVADAASWTINWLAQKALQGQPNDGIVPVSSALPTDSSLPNLVRLVGNDPNAGDYPYPYNHTNLVDNSKVMPDILNALNGGGETAQVSLNITPRSATLAPGQAITLTANVANMLNPLLLWSVSGGTANGTLNQSTGTTVQYTAPQSPGGPFKVTATIPAIELSSSLGITVEQVSNPVPTITGLNPSSLAAGATPQTLTINGTGFSTSSTVTFRGIAHAPAYVSATQLTISLTAADLATAGSYAVVVTNPAPGGGSSNVADFTVGTSPTVTMAVSPSTDIIPTSGTLQFTVTITGTSDTAVDWSVNGISGGNATVGTISSGGLYSAPPSVPTQATITVTATSQAASTSSGSAMITIVPAGDFVLTGNMTTPRSSHTATVLNNSLVLIAGGDDASFDENGLSSAELYGPVSGIFAATGSMITARANSTATLLSNGMVLVTGGFDQSANGALASAELYNPATSTFTATGSMLTARYYHTATLLSDGNVLITGGYTNTDVPLATAEIYDPVSGTFSATGAMTTARVGNLATQLNSGKVLITGGITNTSVLASAELYDPSTGTFSATAGMNAARSGHSATLLNNGKVLVSGGYASDYLASADLYDPVAGTFTATGNMIVARYSHTATLLNNGEVLIAGGLSSNGAQTEAELYDPIAGTFIATGNMADDRFEHAAVLLNDGMVLITGGFGNNGQDALASAELYQAGTLTPPGLASISVTSSALSQSANWTTQQFTATGTFNDGSMQVLQSVTWSSSNTSIATISNDATDRGVAVDIAPGTAVITASDGTVSGTGIFVVTGLHEINP